MLFYRDWAARGPGGLNLNVSCAVTEKRGWSVAQGVQCGREEESHAHISGIPCSLPSVASSPNRATFGGVGDCSFITLSAGRTPCLGPARAAALSWPSFRQ